MDVSWSKLQGPLSSEGQETLACCSPWNSKESDTTKQLNNGNNVYTILCNFIDIKYRMGKTRDLFKKIRDTKGTFQAKMGSIKDRNCMDLTEAEDIKKRWQKYTEELYKKDLHGTSLWF